MGAAETTLVQPCCTSFLGQDLAAHEYESKQLSCGRASCSSCGPYPACASFEDIEPAKICSRTGKLMPCFNPEIEAADRQFSKYGFSYNIGSPDATAESRRCPQAICPAGSFVLLHSHGLSDVYNVRPRLLAWGTFGDVASAVHTQTGALRAVKTVNKTWLRRAYLHMQDGEVNVFVRREVEVLKRLDHPHIVRLYEAFDDQSNFQVVLELCQGGTLTSRIEPSQERLPEFEALGVFRQMLAAVQHLHSHGFVHRDLKPDNFMFAKMCDEDMPFSHEAACLKLIDFGLARRLGVDSGLHNSQNLGTKYFKAPEMDVGQAVLELTDRIDTWALGVILYIIFAAELPPQDASERLKDQVVIGATLLGRISAFGIDLLSHLLSKEPLWRPTALMAMRHAWCTGGPGKFQQGLCTPGGFALLVDEYGLSPKLRRLGLLAVAYAIDDHDIEYASVRRHFQAFEFESEGDITRASIKILCGAGGGLGAMARIVRYRFDELDLDASDTLTWTKFLAIFIKVHGHATTDSSATDVPTIVVSEETCRRAFYLLSDGTDKIWAGSIGELFAPTKSGRVLNYDSRRTANRFSGFAQSMERDHMIREVNPKGCLYFDGFMRMLGNVRQERSYSEDSLPRSPPPDPDPECEPARFHDVSGLVHVEEMPHHLDAADYFFSEYECPPRANSKVAL